MSTKPTVVIVPGAWQTPVVWDRFQEKLRTAGYTTEHVALPSVGGTELPLTGLAEDVAAVRSVVGKAKAEGQNVVLLAHSSGGVVGSNSVEGLGVDGVVYLSAFMLPKDNSLLGMLGGQPLPWMDVQGDRVLGRAEMLPQVAFNDLEAAHQEKWGNEMTHTSAALFATPSGYEPWASGIKCGYIYCTEDNALPYPLQQQMSQQLGPSPITATVKSGHCPFLSAPDELLLAFQTVEAGLAT